MDCTLIKQQIARHCSGESLLAPHITYCHSTHRSLLTTSSFMEDVVSPPVGRLKAIYLSLESDVSLESEE